MRTKLALWVVVFGGAGVATALTYWERNYPVPENIEPLEDVLNLIHTPAFIISVMASHNVHTGAPVLTYSLVFLTYVLLFAALIAIVRWAIRQGKAS